MNARQKFLRVHRSIERLRWIETIVAAAAGAFPEVFAEITQQRGPPAVSRFRVADHRAQLLMRDALFVFALVFDESALFHRVARVEKQHAVRRQPVAARPPSLL